MAQTSVFLKLSPAKFLATVLALLTVAVLVAVPDASALPKKQSPGCTMAQVQAAASAACIKRYEEDIIAGVAYPHHLVCDETGVHCCQGDGSRTFNCQRVSAFRSILRNLFQTPNAPTLQQAP